VTGVENLRHKWPSRFPECFRICRVGERAAVAQLDNAITGL